MLFSMSRGARPAAGRAARKVAGGLTLVLAFAGCSLLGKSALDDKPLEGELIGGGGAGAGDPVGGGGGQPGCTAHTECPGSDTTCRVRECVDGECGFAFAEALTSCTEDEGSVCDGKGACVDCIDQGQCTGTESCVDNLCVPPHCVDNDKNEDETDVDCGGEGCGPCDNGLSCLVASDCKSSFCDEGTCMPCMSSDDCVLVTGTYCDAGVCTAQKPLNELCDGDDACTSEHCVDGVCCDGVCGGECRTCTGGDGKCKPVPTGMDYDGECSADPMAPCGPTGAGCNGDAGDPGCIVEASGTACGGASCVAGMESLESTCDGAGTCMQGATNSCAPFVCGGDSCLSSCGDNGDCAASGDYCDATGGCVACGTDPGGSLTTHNCQQGSPCVAYSCPPGGPCTVICDGNGACQGATIDCPDGYDCTVTCSGGNNVCGSATVNCNGASNCDVSCSSNNGACTGMQVNCGNGACSGTCTGTKPNFACGPSCDCQPCL